MISLISDTYCSQSQRQKVERWLPEAGGRGNRELFRGFRVSVSQDEESPGDGLRSHVRVRPCIELCTWDT